MRAGLLSEPPVIAALRELFVPVHLSALNTPHCLRDPRDAALLRASIHDDTDDFDGGEREAFVLPDGAMQRVFLSLHGRDGNDLATRASHYTAAARRDDSVTRMFRLHGAEALRAVHGELPDRWRELWAGGDDAVAAAAAEPPRWPQPGPGTAGLRVFVRNSYRQYDDLHGCQLAIPSLPQLADWLRPLTRGERRAAMPRELFVALARAIVPRGMVDTELAETSIEGSFVLVVDVAGDGRLDGHVEGRFELRPQAKGEVAKRLNAACLFRSSGRFAGSFGFDVAAASLAALRAVAVDVDFAWLPGYGRRAGELEPWECAPWHRVAVEWARTSL